MKYSLKKQQGVALISVLLVVALMTVIASQMISRQGVEMRRSSSLINTAQARAYSLGGEAFARQILYRDFQASEQAVDHLQEPWAQIATTLEIEGGEMQIEIVDLQGRFNINALVDDEGTVNNAAVEQFQRLQQLLGLSADYTEALINWLDSDDLPAELAAYENSFPANRRLLDVSELRVLSGMIAEDYWRLAPHISAIPDISNYNLNTASAELLQAVTANLTVPALSGIQQRQELGGYPQLSQWLAAEAAALGSNASNFGVSSNYFEVTVTTRYAERVSRVRSILYRAPKDGRLDIVQRQFGLINEQ